MKTGWENDGEANAQGQFVAFIDMEDGSGIQRFVGTSHLEVSNKLLVAQGNATSKIREFTRNTPPEPAKPAIEFKPTPLTADERHTIARDITDPVKGPDAVKRIVESELGAPLADVRERLSADEVQRQAVEARQQAEEFAAETPDYYVCDFNAKALARYMQMNGYAPVKQNFAKAFEELKAAGLIVFKPSETQEEVDSPEPKPTNGGGLPANPAVTTRQRGVVASTGLRHGDSNAQPGRVTTKPKYTRAQIEAMPQDEYRRLLYTDPDFAKAVDAL